MTHGGPHPTSGSSYIIICNGRIAAAQANTTAEKVAAVSACAAAVCAYLGTRYRSNLDHADLQPISIAQHELMDEVLEGGHVENIDEKVAALFDMFYVLEEKYDLGSGGY